MRVFDEDRQEWVGRDREREIAALHARDAVRQRAALRGAVAALAACGVAFGAWALGWKDEPEPTAYLLGPRSAAGEQGGQGEQGDAGGLGAGDAPSPAPTDGASSAAAVPPRGYETVTDPEGFRVAVPIGWSRAEVESLGGGMSVVNFRDYGANRRLQVYEVSEPSPEASFRDFLDDTKVPKSPAFRKLSLRTLGDGTRPAARLTYVTGRIDGEPDVGTWYVVDHRFEAADGKRYALVGYGARAAGLDEVKALVSTALTWFCPPDTVCPEPGTG
ncbi:hypothetical protein GCM10018785_70840 [Streptomyces longispororuber]|uniref:Uncharacterized protein n=1 Tax=Streptomyces longispororuber TaxID=68230 RepID=A0A919DZZ0_9ACTN|nr:hypothetical protein [Streptomyces longispororuber]GHE95484.1 hypothetical protein GCM10018785_70840 [Streptomyces longispororuber]